jgi:hypothetical protein
MLTENHDSDGIWRSCAGLSPATGFCKLPTELSQYAEVTMNQINLEQLPKMIMSEEVFL